LAQAFFIASVLGHAENALIDTQDGMSFSKAYRPGKSRPGRRRTKSEDVGSEIANLLENRGIPPLAAQAITYGKEIGKGRFKRVVQGTLRQKCGQACSDVVILRYAKKDSEVKELDILAVLAGHPHSSSYVPEVFGVVHENTAVSVIQELAIWGTLKGCLTGEASSLLTAVHKVHIGAQLARCLDFLQTARIVHADLACRNILLFKLEEDPQELIAKITDFGLAVFLTDGMEEQFLRQPQATRWCAPETVAYGKLSPQSDVWSFAVTFWEMFSGGETNAWARLEKRADVTAELTRLAHIANRAEETEESDETGLDLSTYFPLPDGVCPAEAYRIMLTCLEVAERDRPTAAQLGESLQAVFEEENHYVAPEPEEPEATLEEAETTIDSIGSSVAVTAAVSLCGSLGDPESSTASTTVSPAASSRYVSTVSKTLVRQLSSALLEVEKETDANVAKFEIMNDFLRSHRSVEVLGEATVDKMRRELREALRREAHLSAELQEADRELQEAHLASLDETTPSTSSKKAALTTTRDSEVQTEVIPAEPAQPKIRMSDMGTQTAIAPIRELRLERAPGGDGRVRCWASAPALDIWTLFSLVEDDVLLRRDYASESLARAAMEAEGTGAALVKQAIYSSM